MDMPKHVSASYLHASPHPASLAGAGTTSTSEIGLHFHTTFIIYLILLITSELVNAILPPLERFHR